MTQVLGLFILMILSGCNMMSSEDNTPRLESSTNNQEDPTRLSAPRSLQAQGVTSNAFSVSWQMDQQSNPSDPLTFELDWNPGGESTTTSFSQQISNLSPATTYQVRVRARSGELLSDWSNTLSVTTQASSGGGGGGGGGSATNVFVAANGFVKVDLEHPAITCSPEWQARSALSNYEGQSYCEYRGSNHWSAPNLNQTPFTIRVLIQQEGVYQLNWRNRIAQGNDRTLHNDSWLRLPSGLDAPGEHPLNQNWTKVYLHVAGSWQWHARTNDHNWRLIRQFFSAGVHEIQILGRSQGHAIDQVILHRVDRGFDITRDLEPLPLSNYRP